MKTLCWKITITFSIFLISLNNYGQINYTWNGVAGNWNEPTNWTPNGIPGEVDTASINTDGDYTVTLNIDTTVAKILLGGETGTQTLSVSNRIITIIEDIEISSSGVLTIASSTITGYGSISNSGTFTSSALTLNMEFENEGTATFHGTTDISDTLITKTNSTMKISSYTGGVIKFTSAKGFVNNGLLQCLTYNYWGGGFFNISNGTLVNAVDASFEVSAPGTLSSSHSPFNLELELENNGLTTISHNTVLNKTDAIHTNNGYLSILQKSFTITQVGTISATSNSGTISTDNTGSLSINGGTFNFLSGQLDVLGSFAISNCNVNLTPVFTNNISLSFTGSIINCASSFSNQNGLTIINSVINGNDLFSNQDTLSARGVEFNMDFANEGMASFSGVCEMNDTLILSPNSTFRISSYSNIAIDFYSAKGIRNDGLLQMMTYNYWAGGIVDVGSGLLLNSEEGSIEVLVPGVVSSSSTALRLSFLLDNQGEILINHKTILDKASAQHVNNGTIEVSEYPLTLTQTGTTPSFTNTGTFYVDSTGSLSITGGEFNYNSGLLSLDGSLSITSTSLNVVPEFINNSNITLNSSILNCTAGFTNQSDLSIITSTINGGELFTNMDTMSVNGVEFNMGFNNMGKATFSGNVDINDTLITHPNTTLNISSHIGGAMDFTSLKGFTNMGLLQCLQYNYWGRGIVSVYNGKLINSEDGIFNVLVLGTLSSSYSPFVLDIELENHGEVYIDHSTNINKVAGIHKNSGTFTIKNNILSVQQAGTIFNNEPTGSIFGDGTLAFTDAAFANSGAINPGLSPGLLNIITDVAQDSTSEINIELGGLTVGDLHDKLNITGSMVLDGQLNISLINDFNPTAGDVFDVIGFSSTIGEFDKINGTYPGTGIIFTIETTATNINILTEAHENNSPLVEIPIADIQANEDFEGFVVADLDTLFSDIDISLGDELSYSLILPDNILEAGIIGNELRLQSIPDSNGIATVIVIGTDAGQKTARDTFEVIILPLNDPPALAENAMKIPDLILNEDFKDSVIANLDTLFTDVDIPDGDSLSYTFNLSNAIVSATLDNATLTLQSQANENGEATLIIFASDKDLLSISDTISIAVSGINDSPGAFSLLSPTNGANLPESETLSFEWEEASDIDGDDIVYTLSLSSTSWDTTIADITVTEFTLTNASNLDSNTEHNWSVTATDGQIDVNSTEIFSFTTPTVSGIQSPVANTAYGLGQNYPNPFSMYTNIDFSLPGVEYVTIKIYSLTGQLIHTEFKGKLPPGKHTFYFNAENIAGGVYLYKLETNSYNEVKKMTKVD